MKNVVLKYGLIAGILLSVYLLIAMPFFSPDMDMTLSENIGNTVMFIVLGGTMFYGLKKYRDEDLGGSISYGKVFVKGLLITLLAGVLYSLTWTIASEVSDMNFGEMMVEMTMNEMQKHGASDEEISTAIEEIETFLVYYDMPIVKFLVSILEPLMPGIFAALILGFILKRKPVAVESSGSETTSTE